MSFNIRDYVSDDHVESISEIATGQARIIQALSLDNSQKDKEIERLNKLKERYQLEKEVFKDRIDKAIEYIEENKTTHECNEWGFDNMLEDIIPLLDILKGDDKE